MGDLKASVRSVSLLIFYLRRVLIQDYRSYDTLSLTSDVNVHWKAGEGIFKFSGSYGKGR